MASNLFEAKTCFLSCREGPHSVNPGAVKDLCEVVNHAGSDHSWNRYPIPASVSRWTGRDGSFSSLRRNCAKYTRR
jgi:hypothetical protein